MNNSIFKDVAEKGAKKHKVNSMMQKMLCKKDLGQPRVEEVEMTEIIIKDRPLKSQESIQSLHLSCSDPIYRLGNGLVSYFDLLKSMVILFAILSLINLPLLFKYE